MNGQLATAPWSCALVAFQECMSCTAALLLLELFLIMSFPIVWVELSWGFGENRSGQWMSLPVQLTSNCLPADTRQRGMEKHQAIKRTAAGPSG